MLTVELAVEIQVLAKQGKSIRAIARELGISRATIRRYLREQITQPHYTERPKREGKLTPYQDYICQRIEAAKPDWIPATVLYREILERGYTGKESLVRSYVAEFKPQRPDEPDNRFETPAGKQMQVDFTTIKVGKTTIKAFVATLGYSRACYVRFSHAEKQEDWLRGIEEACVYFGGVPQEILFDNAKCIMIERDAYGEGDHRWNAKLLEMALNYGFKPKACSPYRARTKGKVERFNHYLKNSFFVPLRAQYNALGLTVDVDVANAHIGAWLNDVAHQRIHGTTGDKPQVRLEQERFMLQPLPASDHNTVSCASPSMAGAALPHDSLQHPLSTYDAWLEASL